AVWDFIVRSWENIRQTASEVWATIVQIVSGWWESLKEKTLNTWQSIVDWLGGIWESIKTTVSETWSTITSTISGWWDEIWGRAQRFWNDIKTGFVETWQGIKDTTSNIWRGIVNAIIGFINRIIDAINGMIRELNKVSFSVPDWVPIIGGREWGFNIRTIRNIPYLAAGGIITGSGLAVVGEAGPELLSLPRGASVTPLSGGGTVEDAVYRAVYAAIRDAARVERLQGGPSQDTQVVLEIDGQRIARALIPPLAREQQRTGFQLIPREA